MKKGNFILIAIVLVIITALVTYFAMKPDRKAPIPLEKPVEKKVPTIVWKAQSSYPAGLPQLYAPAASFAKKIATLTDGQLVVKMNPGGSIVPSKKIFDAVSAGTLDLGCTWAGWWIGKFPASVLFGNSFPNGLQMREMLSWIYTGGGLELWNELYKGHGIKVLAPYGMLGSENFCWSRKPINSLSDFKGLKFRTVGIWGKCLERLGARVCQPSWGRSIPFAGKGRNRCL